MDNLILVIGNIVDGIEFIGPFTDGEDASEWAENNLKVEWVIGVLNSPEK